MAIKPDDTILNLDTVLVPGIDMFGHPARVPQYPSYWEKFTANVKSMALEEGKRQQQEANHIRQTTGRMVQVDWAGIEDNIRKRELDKYSAVFKRTKKYREYLKFAYPAGLSMFVTIWG